MSAKNLDEYITRMRSILEATPNATVSLTAQHMVALMDIVKSLKQALKKCTDDHANSGHQNQVLDTIDKIIADLDTDDSLH